MKRMVIGQRLRFPLRRVTSSAEGQSRQALCEQSCLLLFCSRGEIGRR
jgi:hypothetical protein